MPKVETCGGDDGLLNYPSSFSPAGKVVLGYFTGVVVPKEKFIHAGWHAVGVALAQAVPDADGTLVLKEAAASQCCDQDECCRCIKAACEAEAAGTHEGMRAIDWKSLAMMILQLVLKAIA